MPKIQIADKPTLDAVSAAVDSKFTPIKFVRTQGSTTEQNQTATVTLLDIRGKGEVLYALASSSLERYNEDTLKITVDDNVIYHVKWIHVGANSTSSVSLRAGLISTTRAAMWINGGDGNLDFKVPDSAVTTFGTQVTRNNFGFSPNLQVMNSANGEDTGVIVVPFRGAFKFEKSFVVEATTNAIQTASTVGWTCHCAYLLEE